jgi:hypothetical protein
MATAGQGPVCAELVVGLAEGVEQGLLLGDRCRLGGWALPLLHRLGNGGCFAWFAWLWVPGFDQRSRHRVRASGRYGCHGSPAGPRPTRTERRAAMSMSAFDPWNYRDTAGYTEGTDLTGYKIAAVDGDIGKVDEATNEPGAAGLVVDTGPWMFGRTVILPAGVVDRVDHDDQKVYVDRTKDQIKAAPSTTRTPASMTTTAAGWAATTTRPTATACSDV